MKTSLLALLVSLIYATVRYNIFKCVPWSDWPTHILNKAFAVAALLLMAICVGRRCLIPKVSNGPLMRMTSLFIALHVILSLALMRSPYYDKFFINTQFTLPVGISMLLGVIALIAFAMGKHPKGELSRTYKTRRLAVLSLVSGIHAALCGYATWFAPSHWPGMMPPLTLISFLLGLAALVVAFYPKPSE